jgi:hypothetical protein
MGYYAEIENSTVVNVIVAESDFINSGAVGDPSRWVEADANTFAGVHEAGGTPLRKNYPSIGYTYDSDRDAFIPPQPEQGNWVLNETTCRWDPVEE